MDLNTGRGRRVDRGDAERIRGTSPTSEGGGMSVPRVGVLKGVPPDDRVDRRDEDLPGAERSEEHTSELQSRSDLVCRLLLEKKKTLTDAGSQRPAMATSVDPDFPRLRAHASILVLCHELSAIFSSIVIEYYIHRLAEGARPR